MSDEDDVEALKNLVGLLRGIQEDQIIADCEISLRDTDGVTDTPMPDTCHPALSHSADFVRRFDQDRVRITMVKHGPAFVRDMGTYPTSFERDTAVLTRQRCWSLAPFVGDPTENEARYCWNIWVDDYGRAIAGPAELIWRFPRE